MASSTTTTRNLNFDCLQHLFLYLTPKEWPQFAEVDKTWNEAAISKDCYEFKYVKLDYKLKDYNRDIERLEVSKFLKILEFVAPKLKCVKLEIIPVGLENIIGSISDVFVSFGRFEYAIKIHKYKEEYFMKNIFLKKAKNVEKLKINNFNGTTPLEWKQFFQTNPVNYFQFFAENYSDHTPFIRHYLPIVPTTLQQIGFSFFRGSWLTDSEQYKISQFLQKMPLLTKATISFSEPILLSIINETLKHSNTITELCLGGTLRNSVNDERILSIIPKFTKLTKLSLFGFTFRDEDECKQIAEKCQYIRRLKILYCNISATHVRQLLLLPNLSELHMNPIQWNLTTEVKNLKKLVIFHYVDLSFDTEDLANALVMMPKLSSLTLIHRFSLTETAARIIKQTIHSRDQNIVLYLLDFFYGVYKFYNKKIGEIPKTPATKKEFALFIFLLKEHEVKLLHELITRV